MSPIHPNPILVLKRLAAVLCIFSIFSLRAFAQVAYDKPTSRVIRNLDGTVLSVKVDPHQQRVEEVLRDANGGMISKLLRELDDDLNPKRALKYDGSNRLVSKHEYLCLKGRVEEEEIYDTRDNLIAKLVYYYDSKNRMTRIEQFNSKGALISVSRSSGGGAEPVVKVLPNTPASGQAPR
jgi:hypothetical protein